MGKSKSLDTEDPPGDGGCLMKECTRALEQNCNSCTETDKARDLELNKEMFDVQSPVEEDCDSRPLLPGPLTPRTKRKFDSVRNLLEKARAKLVRGRRPSSSSDEPPQVKLSEPESPVHRTK